MVKESTTTTTRVPEVLGLPTTAGLSLHQKVGALALDLLYPPRCGGCNRRDTLFCDDCRRQVLPPTREAHGVRGARALVCAGEFSGPLRKTIHRFKYESDRRLSAPLAGFLHGALRECIAWKSLSASPPLVVPVPLHPAKEKDRGYNQSLLLASDLSSVTGWAVHDGLRRTRQTEAQVGLDLEKRRQNVRGAFEWQGEGLPGSVLLIDDVCTTGSTLSECVFALKEAGAERVYVAAVARAPGNSPHADS